MCGQTLNTQLLLSRFDGSTELFCSNCKCEWLSAARAQPHALCQYLPRGRQWLHGLAARRLFDLVEPTRSSSGESKQGPERACGPEVPYRTLRRARGHRASTCVQTLARKCPALTKARGSTAAGSSNWMQLGHFSHVWRHEGRTLGDICEASEWMFLTPAGSIKKRTQTRREDHFSRLIKQSVYDDSCQKDTDALRQTCGNGSSVKSLKWDFWQQRSGRTDE